MADTSAAPGVVTDLGLSAGISSEAPPVFYRGTALRAPKRFLDGTHRCVAPEETLRRIRPHFRAAGLTRLADVTGLDRIGIPVAIAYRPNGRTLSSAAGKGYFREASLVSAAMEAIELYHGENIRLGETWQSYDELGGTGAVIPREDLPLTRRSLFSSSRREVWVRGWDIIGQEEVPVPYAAVSMVRHRRQPVLGPQPFVHGSNGLASGNHLLEAICAALLEVIERDAVSCHLLAEARVGHRRPGVRLDTIEHPLVLDLLRRFHAAEVAPMLYDFTVDTGVPVYLANIYDRQSRQIGLSSGFGAHLDPEIAMLRALTEVAQSRLIHISGSRDDIFRHEDLRHRVADSADFIANLERIPPSIDARERRSEATGSFEGDIAVLIRHLRQVGVRQVIVLDLTHEEHAIPVVRVIVPTLEGYAFHLYEPGRRAKAFCEACAGRQ